MLVIVDGINAATSPGLLDATVQGLLSRRIRIGCAVRPIDDTAGSVQPGSGLAALLARFHTEHTDFVDLIVDVPSLWREAPYFQLRRASDARTALWRALGPDAPATSCVSLLSEEPSDGSAPYQFFRSIGFNTVILRPNDLGTRGYGDASHGVGPLFGGRQVDAFDPAAISSAVAAEIAAGEPAILYVPIAKLMALGEEAASAAVAAIGEAVNSAVTLGDVLINLPSVLGQGAIGGRSLILRVDAASSSGALDEGAVAFIGLLQQGGAAASYCGGLTATSAGGTEGALPPGTSPLVPEALLQSEDAARTLAFAVAKIAAASGAPLNTVTLAAATPEILARLGEAGVGVASLACGSRQAYLGLDRSGVLSLPVPLCFDQANLSDAIDSLMGSDRALDDTLVAIATDTLATPGAREAVASVLVSLSKAPENKLVNIEQYRAEAMPPDLGFALLKATKAERLLADTATGEINEAGRAQLLADAAIAWRYISKQTNAKTGLTAAATSLQPDGNTTYAFLTMWDMGSLLLGIVGAHAVGLIDDDEFYARTIKVLAGISDSRIQGLRLPRLLTSTDRRNPSQDGYDASDTGRLLNCLYVLKQYATRDLGIEKVVRRWNLDKTLEGGRLHSFQNGAFVDVHDSNYTNYLARGFANWGFSVKPVYPEVAGDSETDAQMRVVNAAALYGSVGTEPQVLEEIELGYSDAARTLADMLYTAQLRRYQANGHITCASEGPLDREPWFTYQGYRLDVEVDPWTINTTDNLSRYKTPAFRQSVEMVSTKAAFLWAAVRRQSYSQVMLDYVRDRARLVDLGYASGVYTATGAATANYSDINTTGIILAALAYSLGGHRPLSSQGAASL